MMIPWCIFFYTYTYAVHHNTRNMIIWMMKYICSQTCSEQKLCCYLNFRQIHLYFFSGNTETYMCIYIYIMYNDEKNFADNYLRCLPVVLGTAFVRRTLQETSVHSELNTQTNVCCLSTYLYIYIHTYIHVWLHFFKHTHTNKNKNLT